MALVYNNQLFMLVRPSPRMVQTGDETLDYRLAVEKYAGSKQLVESGGDHSFQNFDRWIADAIDFLQHRR